MDINKDFLDDLMVCICYLSFEEFKEGIPFEETVCMKLRGLLSSENLPYFEYRYGRILSLVIESTFEDCDFDG